MVIATDVKFEHNDVIVIRPEDNAPKDAPTQIQLLVFKLLLKSNYKSIIKIFFKLSPNRLLLSFTDAV